MNRRLFEGMDEGSRAFYSRLFNSALLNIHAVRKGYFDVLFCETDDPKIMIRWREAVPQIVALIKRDQANPGE